MGNAPSLSHKQIHWPKKIVPTFAFLLRRPPPPTQEVESALFRIGQGSYSACCLRWWIRCRVGDDVISSCSNTPSAYLVEQDPASDGPKASIWQGLTRRDFCISTMPRCGPSAEGVHLKPASVLAARLWSSPRGGLGCSSCLLAWRHF